MRGRWGRRDERGGGEGGMRGEVGKEGGRRGEGGMRGKMGKEG